jgi:uncharacterized protein YciI
MKDIRYVVFHSPGSAWDHGKPFFEQAGLDLHVGYFGQLLGEGKVAMGGPHLDGKSGGMMIPVAGLSEDEVRAIAEADPAIKSGLLRFEIRPWLLAMKA